MKALIAALLFLCLSVQNLGAAQPDEGEAAALKDLRTVWFSVQSLVFKSNLSGSQLREMRSSEKSQLKSDLEDITQHYLLSRLSAAGLESKGRQVMVEDAWTYLEEAKDLAPDIRSTRELLVTMAKRHNRLAPNGQDPHLRLFIEIQQDGSRHVGRLELALVEKVYLRRRTSVELSTVVWSKAEEAVPLGATINRGDLEESMDRLLKVFESNLKEIQ